MTELTTPAAPPAQQAPTHPAQRPFRRWLTDRPRGELIAWGVLVAVTFALRIADVGSRPFHHDESQDAYFSHTFTFGGYEYDPLLHGPFRFYLTGLMYLVFGESDTTARLAPVLMGTLVVALTYLLRHQLGRTAAFSAGVLLAVGPSFLYFSRFAREDIYVAAITLGLMVAMFRFLDHPRPATPSIIAALWAVLWATKETVFIFGFVVFTFLVWAVVIQSLRARDWRQGEVVRAVRSVGWAAWVYALATFFIVFSVLFTVFFFDPDGVRKGLIDGIDYWLGQQPVNRGGEPWYFYLAVLFGKEWPVLLLGGVGIAWCVRHPTTQRLFLVWAFVFQLAIYSWASERFSWLVIHPLLPLILLAGLGVQALWAQRRRRLRTAAAVVIGCSLAYTLYASFTANVRYEADPRDWLVSTQSSVEVKQVADEVRALARANPGLSVTVDSAEGATFPYAWYFRDLEVGYIDMKTAGYVPDSQVLVMTEGSRAAQLPNLSAYEGRRFAFRVWWVRDWGRLLSPGAWWDWFTRHETWNATGGMDEWLYVRRDVDG